MNGAEQACPVTEMLKSEPKTSTEQCPGAGAKGSSLEPTTHLAKAHPLTHPIHSPIHSLTNHHPPTCTPKRVSIHSSFISPLSHQPHRLSPVGRPVSSPFDMLMSSHFPPLTIHFHGYPGTLVCTHTHTLSCSPAFSSSQLCLIFLQHTKARATSSATRQTESPTVTHRASGGNVMGCPGRGNGENGERLSCLAPMVLTTAPSRLQSMKRAHLNSHAPSLHIHTPPKP